MRVAPCAAAAGAAEPLPVAGCAEGLAPAGLAGAVAAAVAGALAAGAVAAPPPHAASRQVRIPNSAEADRDRVVNTYEHLLTYSHSPVKRTACCLLVRSDNPHVDVRVKPHVGVKFVVPLSEVCDERERLLQCAHGLPRRAPAQFPRNFIQLLWVMAPEQRQRKGFVKRT